MSGWAEYWNSSGGFGNTSPTYNMNEAAARFDAYYAAKRKWEAAEQARKEEELIEQQSSTRCYTSEVCAAGFTCSGGFCSQGSDLTGATSNGQNGFTFGSLTGTSGCGTGPSNPDWSFSSSGTSDAPDGGGCNSNTSGTGGSFPALPGSGSGCATSSAGVCSIHPGYAGFGSYDGGGGGGDDDCGGQAKCCTCGTEGCSCSPGVCPPRKQGGCSRFCDEGKDIGLSLCADEESYCDECEDCVDRKCVRRYHDTCTCDSPCTGCDTCSKTSGKCLRKPCPPLPPPKDEGATTGPIDERKCLHFYAWGGYMYYATSCGNGGEFSGYCTTKRHNCFSIGSCGATKLCGGHANLDWKPCVLDIWTIHYAYGDDDCVVWDGYPKYTRVLPYGMSGDVGTDLAPIPEEPEEEGDPPLV